MKKILLYLCAAFCSAAMFARQSDVTLNTGAEQASYDTNLNIVGVKATSYDTDRGFVHPGGLHSQADFDRVRAQIVAGNTRVTQAYQKLKTSSFASSSYNCNPQETVVRGGTGQNYMQAARDACAAYQNALRWKIEDNTACANTAVRILNAWARTTKTITGDSNLSLAAGLYGYQFAQAAELMRDYEGWERDDFEAFRQWMLGVWYKTSIWFLRTRSGTWENSGKWWQAPGHYWSNWGLCNALCVLSIGVLCDDVFIYNQGLSFIKRDQCGTWQENRTLHEITGHGDLDGQTAIWNDGLTEYLGNLVVTTADSPLETGAYGQLGQTNESGRDTGHPAMAMALAVDIAYLLWNQGDDLFSYMDHRLAAGIEYIAAQVLSVEGLPWTNYMYGTNGVYYTDSRCWTMTAPCLGVQIRPCWQTVVHVYEGIKGVTMPFSEQVLEKMGIDGGGGGSTSGGYDQLGFNVLMHTLDRQLCPADEVPTELSGYIQVGTSTIKMSEYGGHINKYTTNNTTAAPKAGKTMTLTPVLPDGEEDTGLWQWNTGETTRTIDIKTGRSYVYRVTYTNARGVKSQKAFSIASLGDSNPIQNFTTTITVNNALVGTTKALVPKGSRATLTIGGLDFCSWQWWNGSTAATVTTGLIQSDTTFTVTVTGQGGAVSVREIHIKISDDSRPTTGLLYYQDFETPADSSGLLPDSMGYYPATLAGSAERRYLDDGNWAAYTGSSQGYIDLGETLGAEVMSQLKANYTISLDLCVTTPNQLSKYCWAWALSNGTTQYVALVNAAGNTNWYYEIKDGTASQCKTASSLTVNQWHTVTLVQKGTTATIYVDGTEKGTATVSTKPSAFGYALTDNWLGRSPFSGDAYMTNTYMDNLRIYNTALTADEVKTLADRRPTSRMTGDPSAIGSVWADGKGKSTDAIYNFYGQRVDEGNLTPGIYIVDGKKTLIR